LAIWSLAAFGTVEPRIRPAITTDGAPVNAGKSPTTMGEMIGPPFETLRRVVRRPPPPSRPVGASAGVLTSCAGGGGRGRCFWLPGWPLHVHTLKVRPKVKRTSIGTSCIEKDRTGCRVALAPMRRGRDCAGQKLGRALFVGTIGCAAGHGTRPQPCNLARRSDCARTKPCSKDYESPDNRGRLYSAEASKTRDHRSAANICWRPSVSGEKTFVVTTGRCV